MMEKLKYLQKYEERPKASYQRFHCHKILSVFFKVRFVIIYFTLLAVVPVPQSH